MLLIIFHVGKERYGLDSGRIIEVVPQVVLKPVPHTPPYVAGLFNYRGQIAPVVDLSALISGEPCKPRLSTRVVLVDYPGVDRKHVLGLMAERVTETLKCREEDFNPPGILTPEGPYLGDIFIDEKGMIQRIEVEEILPHTLRESLFTSAEKEADALPAH